MKLGFFYCCLFVLQIATPACAQEPDLDDPAVITQLIHEMRHDTGRGHERARDLLLKAGESAVPLLVRDLLESWKSGNTWGIGYTEPLLEEIGVADEATVSYILDTLDTAESAEVAGSAMYLLVVLNVPAERSLPHVMPLLEHPDFAGIASHNYWKISGDSGPLIENFRTYLKGSDSFLRNTALGIIARELRADAAELVPEILALVVPEGPSVDNAIEALGAIGPPASEALPLLHEISASGNSLYAPLADEAIALIEAKP